MGLESILKPLALEFGQLAISAEWKAFSEMHTYGSVIPITDSQKFRGRCYLDKSIPDGKTVIVRVWKENAFEYVLGQTTAVDEKTVRPDQKGMKGVQIKEEHFMGNECEMAKPEDIYLVEGPNPRMEKRSVKKINREFQKLKADQAMEEQISEGGRWEKKVRWKPYSFVEPRPLDPHEPCDFEEIIDFKKFVEKLKKLPDVSLKDDYDAVQLTIMGLRYNSPASPINQKLDHYDKIEKAYEAELERRGLDVDDDFENYMISGSSESDSDGYAIDSDADDERSEEIDENLDDAYVSTVTEALQCFLLPPPESNHGSY